MADTTTNLDAASPWLALPTSLHERMLPAVTPETERFWAGFNTGKLVLDRCTECDRVTFPPVDGCSFCGASSLVEFEAPLTAEVHTYTVCHLAYGTGMELPYVVGVVTPNGSPEAKIVTNVVECHLNEVSIGMTVELFVVHGEPQSLLFARPASNDSNSAIPSEREITNG